MTEVDPYSSPESEVVSVLPADRGNPHTLWKQVTGVVIASILIVFVAGISVILTAAFTFVDAWQAGIFKIKNKSAFTNLSPMGWAIAMEGIFIVAFPVYLFNRNKLKTKEGNSLFFILTIVFGVLSILLIVLRFYLLLLARGSG